MQNQQRKNFFADRLLKGQARNSSTSVSSFSPVLTLLSKRCSSDSMHVSYFYDFSKHLVCICSTILPCVSLHLSLGNLHISQECRVQVYKFLVSSHLLTSLRCYGMASKVYYLRGSNDVWVCVWRMGWREYWIRIALKYNNDTFYCNTSSWLLGFIQIYNLNTGEL